MADVKVYSFLKNSNETVCVSLTEYKGHALLDLRVFVRDPNSGAEIATPKGLCLSRALAGELLKGLQKVVKAIKDEKA